MTIEEICNKYIKVKATGILALHQRPKLDWAFKVVSGKESDVCNGCFLEKYYPLRLPYTCAAQQREDGKNVQFKKISKTMTREETKELLPIMQAFAEGKTIQFKTKDRPWFDLLDNNLEMREVFKYRIKPEPKYRPFKSQEECWNEMLKHQPFGWVKSKVKGYFHLIGLVQWASELEDVMIIFATSEQLARSSRSLFEDFIFADGTPFGIKE